MGRPASRTSVDELRIAKDRCPVTLSLLGGDVLEGVMFVQAGPDGAPPGETPRDVLNGPDRFLPVETEQAEVVLVPKDRIVEARAEGLGEPDELRRASARSAVLELTLAGGIRRTGLVLIEMPSAQPRLLDFLNRDSERFLTLYASDGPRLVNRMLIERVRPLD